MRLLFKGRGRPAAPDGKVSDWADGTKRKKQAGKWIVIGRSDKGRKYSRSTKPYKESKIEKDLTKLGESRSPIVRGVFEDLEDMHGIRELSDLKKEAKKRGLGDVFRTVRASVRSTAREIAEDRGMDPDDLEKREGMSPQVARLYQLQRAAEKQFGSIFARISDNERAGKPEARKMTFEPAKDGYKYVVGADDKTYEYEGRYKKKEMVPDWTESQLGWAEKFTGGWNDMSRVPKVSEIRKMIKQGNAELKRGKIQKTVPFTVPARAQYHGVPFRKEEKAIFVTMHQRKDRDTRGTILAEVEVKVPFEFAHDFLSNHLGQRTGNQLKREMERSAPYQRATHGLELTSR